MTLYDAAGDPVTEAGLTTNLGSGEEEVTYTADQRYYETFTQTGTDVELRRLKFYEGQKISASQKAAIFPDPVIYSISPSTGAVAGGTVITLTGAHLTGATGVTFGGTAGTALTVVDSGSLTVTAPAKTAGSYDVVVTTPNGTGTLTGGYTAA